MLWRVSANNTHLYPGAILRHLDFSGDTPLESGDEVLVEFSDGAVVSGRLTEADRDAVVLQLSGYRTQSGTNVAARTWRLVSTDEPERLRVLKRLSVP